MHGYLHLCIEFHLLMVLVRDHDKVRQRNLYKDAEVVYELEYYMRS